MVAVTFISLLEELVSAKLSSIEMASLNDQIVSKYTDLNLSDLIVTYC